MSFLNGWLNQLLVPPKIFKIWQRTLSLSGSVYQKDSQTIVRGDIITYIDQWGGEYIVDFWMKMPSSMLLTSKQTKKVNLLYVADDISDKKLMAKSMLPEINTWNHKVFIGDR